MLPHLRYSPNWQNRMALKLPILCSSTQMTNQTSLTLVSDGPTEMSKMDTFLMAAASTHKMRPVQHLVPWIYETNWSLLNSAVIHPLPLSVPLHCWAWRLCSLKKLPKTAELTNNIRLNAFLSLLGKKNNPTLTATFYYHRIENAWCLGSGGRWRAETWTCVSYTIEGRTCLGFFLI